GGATSLFGQASCVVGSRQISRGLAGLLMEGRFDARIRTLTSARGIGKKMTVTRCQANLVQELDGLPALAVFQNLDSRVFGLDPLRRAQSLFVALHPAGSQQADAPFVVRNLIGFDPARQLLALSQPVEVGAELGFCILEPAEARRRLAEGLEALRGTAPSFA